MKHSFNIVKQHETLEHSSFDATISALDAETSALGSATSAIVRTYRRYRFGVFGDIGDCGVGITPQMCNRVTNHGDMGTFSKPALPAKPNLSESLFPTSECLFPTRR